MLIDTVKKYRNPELYDLSCSETIMYACNEEYNLGVDNTTLRAMAPFSGGMSIGDFCGTLSASLAVLGIMFTNNVSHDSDKLKTLSLEMTSRFQKLFETYNCELLKEKYRTEDEGCNYIIYETAYILDEIIKNAA